MTDRSKFEQMLEYLISEEEDKAKELFHQLVVEKSREIYEQILSEDFTEAKEEDDEEMDEAKEEDDDEELDEASEEDDEEMDENFGFEGADEEGEEDEGGEIGGDATDDFMGDIDADDEEGDEMGGEGDIEDRVMDLEDALDDLKAEFERLMSGEEGDEMGGDDMGMDGDDMDMGMDVKEPKMDSFDVSDNFMREYIEKVANPKHGDNGDNTKSIIDNMKNDMGGTTANIAKGGEAGGKGVQSGLLKPNTKEENFGNINVPGGNAGKTAFKKKEPGHGAEKKGSGDNGDNKTSPISGLKSRAK
jgi:hypothetical protein